METKSWLVMNYTLPKEPSRARVSVWRKLKKAGAVNVQQSMWILPDTGANYDVLNTIKDEVLSCGGEAYVMHSTVDEQSGSIFAGKMNSARCEEYKELLEQCGEFLKEIEKETLRANFSFAEIEENEEDLGKLKKWFDLISSRDFFCASLREESASKLGECGAALEAFSESVYEAVNKESD
jgi:CRISPR/Cas system-associated endoribonuclease Cas2